MHLAPGSGLRGHRWEPASFPAAAVLGRVSQSHAHAPARVLDTGGPGLRRLLLAPPKHSQTSLEHEAGVLFPGDFSLSKGRCRLLVPTPQPPTVPWLEGFLSQSDAQMNKQPTLPQHKQLGETGSGIKNKNKNKKIQKHPSKATSCCGFVHVLEGGVTLGSRGCPGAAQEPGVKLGWILFSFGRYLFTLIASFDVLELFIFCLFMGPLPVLLRDYSWRAGFGGPFGVQGIKAGSAVCKGSSLPAILSGPRSSPL